MQHNMTATEVQMAQKRWHAECKIMGKAIQKLNNKLMMRLIKRILITASDHGPITQLVVVAKVNLEDIYLTTI